MYIKPFNKLTPINTRQEEYIAETINTPNLLNKLFKLEDRLEAIAKALKDEVQLFIASIHIQDSKIAKGKAARTALLAILALILLPLQLITGIFGMNIKEITENSPSRWWVCLVALGICGLLTFLVFLGVRWWR